MFENETVYVGDIKCINEDNLISIQVKYCIYKMRCLSNRLSVKGIMASIKSLAKHANKLPFKKDKYIFLTSGEIGRLSFYQFIHSPNKLS